jgi:hypothetical protein
MGPRILPEQLMECPMFLQPRTSVPQLSLGRSVSPPGRGPLHFAGRRGLAVSERKGTGGPGEENKVRSPGGPFVFIFLTASAFVFICFILSEVHRPQSTQRAGAGTHPQAGPNRNPPPPPPTPAVGLDN